MVTVDLGAIIIKEPSLQWRKEMYCPRGGWPSDPSSSKGCLSLGQKTEDTQPPITVGKAVMEERKGSDPRWEDAGRGVLSCF